MHTLQYLKGDQSASKFSLPKGKSRVHSLSEDRTEHSPNFASSGITMAETADIAPLGTLSILPRELRNQIYSHVCSPSYYYTTWYDKSRMTDRQIWYGESEDSLSLLVSKMMHAEYRSVLYSDGLFEIDRFAFSNKIQRNYMPFVNDICNVSILLDLDHPYERRISPSYEGQRISSIRAEPVSYFTSGSRMRRKCRLELRNYSQNALLLLQSPLIRAISRLIGFKTVQLVFSTKPKYWDKDMEPYESLKTIIHGISCALEPALGSFTVHADSDEPYPWSQYVKFHPHGHQIMKSRFLEAESGDCTS